MRGLIACELCVYSRHMSESPAFVCCLQSGVVLELHRTAASQIKPSLLSVCRQMGWKGLLWTRPLQRNVLRTSLPSATHALSLKSTVTDEEQWIWIDTESVSSISLKKLELSVLRCNEVALAQDVSDREWCEGPFSSHCDRRVHTETKTNGSEEECTILN